MIASTTVLDFSLFLHFFSFYFLQGLYGEEFEEDFAVTTLGNTSGLTDAANGDDAGAELLEPPEDITIITQEQQQQQPEEAIATQPIPTLDSRPRLSADALPPKPSSAGGGGNGGPLSYSAQVAEQFSSSYRQTPSQERGRLDAARLAQFQVNQTGAPSGASAGADARPIRPSEMKDEGCVFFFLPALASLLFVREWAVCPYRTSAFSSYLAVVSTSLPPVLATHAFLPPHPDPWTALRASHVPFFIFLSVSCYNPR
ncbi:hypothetical protein EI94DRAFT_1271131 [Lactarius quietus]|nr:hypothetical protein EI94DRAFT_1271131 [Lactarius quietus]